MNEVLTVSSDGVDDDTMFEALGASPFPTDEPIGLLQKNNADAAVIVHDGSNDVGMRAIEFALREGIPLHVEGVGFDGLLDNNLTEEELLRRYPEIKQIDGLQFRGEVVEALISNHPDYIWEVPSSGSGKYHPPDERGKHGQWLHVKRMFYAYDEMSDSLVQAGEITEAERESGKAAVFFHDLFKNGFPKQKTSAVKFHDILAANFVRECTDLPELVAELCETHNGPWGDGRTPETAHEWVFHEADMIASRNASNLGVYDAAEELQEISDDLIDARDP